MDPRKFKTTLESLKVFPLASFIPKERKKGGSRKGALGYFQDDNRYFMLKIEHGGYPCSGIGEPDEICIAESFTARLIRAIWGEQFAANIHLVLHKELPCSISMPKLYKDPLKVDFKYNVASIWNGKAKSLGDHYFSFQSPEITLTQKEKIVVTTIQTIAILLNISDYKPGNLISMETFESLCFVDCVALVSETTTIDFEDLLTPKFEDITIGEENFIKDAVMDAVKAFVEFTNLNELLTQYENIFRPETINQIKIGFVSLQDQCKEFLDFHLNVSKKLNQLSLFAPQTISEVEPSKPHKPGL